MRYVLFILLFFSGIFSLHGQNTGLSPEISKEMARIDRRLELDISALAGLPKDHRPAIEREYRTRADSVKSALNSGQFLRDSLWSGWFEQILAEIYRGNSGLPAADIRLYIGRGEEPNAWCVGEGTLVFNLGMMPFMENESQVAFILCHELAHYTLNHGNQAIAGYVDRLYDPAVQKRLKAIERGRVDKTEKAMNLLQGMTYTSRRHSRFKETEADSLGLALLARTRYDCREAIGAMRMLDSIDQFEWPRLPYKALLDAPQFPFRDSWLQAPVKSALSMQAAARLEDGPPNLDSLRTHPDCQKRLGLLQQQMRQYPATGSRFLQGESLFQQLKRKSLFELIDAQYAYRNYGRCLFRTIALLGQYPESARLNARVVQCLFYIHRYQEAHALRSVVDLPRPGFSKEYRFYLEFVNRLQLSEIAQLGFYYHLNRKDRFGKDEDFMFAGVLAGHMWKRQEEFEGRKTEYLNQFPKGKYVALLNTL